MYKTHHAWSTFGSWDVQKVHAAVAPLWREAQFEVKMYKAHPARSTLGSWDVQKVHAAVARSTCRSPNVQSTHCSEHFWQLRCSKGARRCDTKHMLKSKCTKHTLPRALLEVEMFKRCTPLWREAHFEVKCGLGALFQVRIWFCAVSAKDSAAPSQEREKRHSFVAVTKNVGEGQGRTFEEDLQRYISRGRRSTRDMFITDVRRSGRWFPERGCILVPQIFRFAKIILRHRCSTSYDLASLFRGRRRYFRQMERNNCKTHWYEAVSSALDFPFLKEVSPFFVVFDAVNFGNWVSLAELLLFFVVKLKNLGCLAE